MSRAEFRARCVERDGGECLVPTCEKPVTKDPDGPGEVHHIIERKLWPDGGYIPENGASVCNEHHRMAEDNIIPPQAFWRWSDSEGAAVPERGKLPKDRVWQFPEYQIDKWGEQFETPSWQEHRKYIKYPSTRHLPWSHERDDDDTAHESLDWLTGYPLIATKKMDGGNAMLVKDSENPIRARNGRHADKEHFDMAKQWYWDEGLYAKLPEHLQVFGEWLYAKHSIHYGCDCDKPCEDVGPALEDYFQVFGMYDTRYNLWLGWHETVELATEMDLTVVPYATEVYGELQFEETYEAWDTLYELSQHVVEQGHEGVVVRSALPFHYGQIDRRLGKYVRPGHVKEGEKHWSKRPLVQNQLQE